MVRETDDFTPERLIYPLFICPGEGVRRPIDSMPGCFQWSVDQAASEAARLQQLGIGGVLLFGIPHQKDDVGAESASPTGVIPSALHAIKSAAPRLLLWADVCLCEYTSHGHCGILDASGAVDNDATLPALVRSALAYARAGADVIAPSDMMDGRVAAIRQALDEQRLHATPIFSYASKYASAFYGPFREAAQSAPQFGDRRAYQMDPANAREALREIQLDLEEGADGLIVKPALAYGDMLWRVKERFDVPVAAYNVSGEYAMVKAAAARGWIDEKAAVREILLGIRRAGADMVITYFAPDFARSA